MTARPSSPWRNPSRHLAWSFRRWLCRRNLQYARYSCVSASRQRRKSRREEPRWIAPRAASRCVRQAGLLALILSLAACPADDGHDHDHDHDHDNEIISRVELSFAPEGGGDALVFAFDDPDGDGGVSGSAETIEL